MTLLIIAVIVLFVVAAVRVMNIYELSAGLHGGRKDDSMTDKENQNMAGMWVLFMIAFFGFCLWQVVKYSDKLLPEAASAHGPKIDLLFNITLAVIGIVFIITHIILVYQIYVNAGKKGRKGVHFAHSNKLELIWTVVPAIVLSGIIAYGLTIWDEVIYPGNKDAVVIELYSKQFDWTARYAGIDNKLGGSDYRSISATNDLGLLEDEYVNDDIIVKGEFHIPVNSPVHLKFRSRDVIHSAFLPHFRVQMNCVPGMETSFEFTPTITSAEMREKVGNKDFNYIVLCNKVCGAAHYNMQIDVIVDTEEDYQKWVSEQKTWLTTQAAATASIN